MEGKNLIRAISLVAVFLIFTLSSCKESATAPDLSEDEIVAVLVDMHLADATLLHLTGKAQFSPDAANPYYEKVLKKHNLTREEFDNAMKTYAENPEQLNKLYDKVVESLTRMDDGLQGKDSIK